MNYFLTPGGGLFIVCTGSIWRCSDELPGKVAGVTGKLEYARRIESLAKAARMQAAEDIATFRELLQQDFDAGEAIEGLNCRYGTRSVRFVENRDELIAYLQQVSPECVEVRIKVAVMQKKFKREALPGTRVVRKRYFSIRCRPVR